MGNHNLRETLAAAMKVNAPLVEGIASSRSTLTADETALVESLRTHPNFGSVDKTQIDRHTLTHMFSAISDKPISVCASAASKCEKLIEAGIMTSDLSRPKTLVETQKRSRKEAKEVPEERPASKDGDGELPQGDADTVAADHDGKDVGKLAKGTPSGDADKGASQDKDVQGDKSDTDKEGYIKEEDDEDDDVPVEEEADDLDPQLGDEKEENIDTENPNAAGKAAQDLPEQDVAPLAPPAAPAAAPVAPAPKAEKKVKKESEDDDADDFGDDVEEAEEAPQDAKDPANDDKDRAANDATYRDGAKQNEALKEDGLDLPNQTKDAEDLPALDKVQKEDPSGSELNKGPASVELESLAWIEKRINGILREAGLKQGSRRWTEAYLKGWSLAMEQRVRRLSEGK
jgi:hypothetical protein